MRERLDGWSIKLSVCRHLAFTLDGCAEIERDGARIQDSKFRIRYNFLILSEEADRGEKRRSPFRLLMFYTSLMKTLSPDTSPEVERIMIEGYRKMSAARKLEIMQDLINAACLLALGDIKRTHPKADQHEIMLRLASRRIEPELMRKAFGWNPEVEGY